MSDELVWHRDKTTRLVEVLSGEGWLFQMDDCLPVEMRVGDMYKIPAYAYHRIKRGTTDLIIRITE
jgi:quercetin dioxygenase-like cupin family protein